MSRYFVARAVQTVLTLLLMSLVVYLLIGLMPGDPIDMMISGDPTMTSQDAARLRAAYGLDKPLFERYLAWLLQALQGNFGYSRSFGQPVLTVLWPRLLNTLLLAGIAFAISVAIALPLGMWAAAHPRSRADYLINLLCFGGISAPPFWLALLLITLFSVKLGWLPAGSRFTVGDGSFLDFLHHLIAPSLVLALVTIAIWSRYMRAAMLEVINQDFVRTARAKGLPERVILTRHTIRNAMLPMITIAGLQLPTLLSGALVTETVFTWPGMGRLFLDSISYRDYPTVMGILMCSALLVLLGNLLADLCYAVADPRIRLD